MKNTQMIVAIVVLVAAVALFAGMQMTKNSQTKNPTMTVKTEETKVTSSPSGIMIRNEESKESTKTEEVEQNKVEKSPYAKEIVVQGSNFKFEPSTITVKKGEKVRILFKNAGGFHDFVIDELHVKTAVIKDGEEDFAEFTPDKAGTYEFYCSVGNHRAMGMKGTITVE